MQQHPANVFFGAYGVFGIYKPDCPVEAAAACAGWIEWSAWAEGGEAEAAHSMMIPVFGCLTSAKEETSTSRMHLPTLPQAGEKGRTR